jgi:hypothetical protein
MWSYGTRGNWLESLILKWGLPAIAASLMTFAGCGSDDDGGVYAGGTSGAGGGQSGSGGKGGQSGSAGQSGGSGQSGAGGQAGSGQSGSGGTPPGDSGTCPDDPNDDPCALCRKVNCCPQVQACERAAQCRTCSQCLVGALPSDCTQSGECSAADPATAALLNCMQQTCVEC